MAGNAVACPSFFDVAKRSKNGGPVGPPFHAKQI